MSYQIITDATADMEWSQWDVAVIPMEVLVDRYPYRYGPEGDLSVESFYDALRAGAQASTCQITPHMFSCVFEEYLKKGIDILYLSFSSGMSGTFQSACISAAALRKSYPERRLLCVDTKSASIREGFLVYEAARKKAEGMDLETLFAWVTQQRRHICCWFTVDDLDTLKRGGRISQATVLMGTALKVKPILSIDDEGRLKLVGKVRGRKRAVKSMLDYFAQNKRSETGELVLIGHGDCKPEADALGRDLQARFPGVQVLVTPIGPVIGAHTGPDMLAITFWGKTLIN